MAALSWLAEIEHTRERGFSMHNLYIVGAGAQGRVAYGHLERDVHWKICGFLDDRKTALDGYDIPLEIVGDAFTYTPKNDDIFICAVGNSAQRRHYSAPLIAKGAKFMNVFTEIYAGSNLKLGEGVFFERNVRIGPDCTIGNFAIVNSTSILGHDISVGAYSQIGSFVFMETTQLSVPGA
jgi:hypothetical protein